jgi:hypothetical protein
MGRWSWVLGVAVVAWLVVEVGAQAQEDGDWKPIEPLQLPAAVSRELQVIYPKGLILKVFAGVGDDAGLYRAVLSFGAGSVLVVVLTEDGIILGGRDPAVELAPGELPREVAQGVARRYPKAELRAAWRDGPNDRSVFWVSLQQDGRRTLVRLGDRGQILRVQTEIAARDLPSVVSRAVRARYPEARLLRVLQVAEGEEPAQYAVLLHKSGWPLPLRLVLDPDGRLLKEFGVEPPQPDGSPEHEAAAGY